MKVNLTSLLLTVVLTAGAAEVKQQSLEAWQAYVLSATARMRQNLRAGGPFLKVNADQDWGEKVRSGEILVVPGSSQGLVKVPAGMIHDWLAVAFIPHTTINEVLSVVRDYNRYKDLYRPVVINSTILSRGEREDRFSIVFMNKSIFFKAALESEFECSYVRVTEKQWYSVAKTTRVQEIANYGEPGQRTLVRTEASGFIWQLAEITRYEERDDGVYIELEAMALSRDIPVSLRWIVEPIVRRVSRSSLTTSLRRTQDALCSGAGSGSCVGSGLDFADQGAATARNSSARHSVR